MSKKSGALGPVTILVKKDGKLFANDALNDCRCRWPIGEPHEAGFHFCGNRKQPSPKTPYCEFHERLSRPKPAAEPIQPMKNRDIKAA